MSDRGGRGLPSIDRRTGLLLALLVAVVATVVMVAATAKWGERALAVPVTLASLLLVAHTLRSEQQSRRLHQRISALDAAVKKQRVQQRTALREIAATTGRTGRRVDKVRQSISDPSKGLLHGVRKVSRHSFEQVQATLNLFEMVEIKAAIPPMRGWAVSPDALVVLVQELVDERPTLVVECGSGISTLFLALAARQNDIDTRIVALDHEEDYAAKTNQLLARHGVGDIAEARHAPLVDVPGADGVQQWYDPAKLDDLDGIGLLFVDGPPAPTARLARFPALPQTWDRLAPRTSVVLDDMIRPAEQEVVKLWQAAHPELEHEHLRTEKGTDFLRRS
ncbi:class I SAM-dependent methyltransferase [Aeromicrobium sp. 9AM]|uniref:class I SAM-dependent methyltransferase n=1 Tax=Aeromicrobium sp. 9AM TaxID=2653126 RepID=UPI0012F3F3CE|nr:class I SAM-dependent methyltransferase [Aeromicrobium sp. 9AM]VXB53993.1 conserved hypothetical protein [Aeromicrobium sp. 9AM]